MTSRALSASSSSCLCSRRFSSASCRLFRFDLHQPRLDAARGGSRNGAPSSPPRPRGVGQLRLDAAERGTGPEPPPAPIQSANSTATAHRPPPRTAATGGSPPRGCGHRPVLTAPSSSWIRPPATITASRAPGPALARRRDGFAPTRHPRADRVGPPARPGQRLRRPCLIVLSATARTKRGEARTAPDLDGARALTPMRLPSGTDSDVVRRSRSAAFRDRQSTCVVFRQRIAPRHGPDQRGDLRLRARRPVADSPRTRLLPPRTPPGCGSGSARSLAFLRRQRQPVRQARLGAQIERHAALPRHPRRRARRRRRAQPRRRARGRSFRIQVQVARSPGRAPA